MRLSWVENLRRLPILAQAWLRAASGLTARARPVSSEAGARSGSRVAPSAVDKDASNRDLRDLIGGEYH
jgi:hypothetical protein